MPHCRRYRDFVWLRERLCAAFPSAIVPPLPEPDSLLKDDRFSSTFIQRRQAGLQLFLRRVAAHHKLARGADLQMFLEAKVSVWRRRGQRARAQRLPP